jgi:hypothetical protein
MFEIFTLLERKEGCNELIQGLKFGWKWLGGLEPH